MSSSAKKQKLKNTTSKISQRVFTTPQSIGGRVPISVKRTAEKLGCHELTVYRYLKNIPDFPRPIKLTPHRTAFFEDEIDDYLATRPRV